MKKLNDFVPDNSVLFSEWIRKKMVQRNISLGELSVSSGIPKSTLHGWANGRLDQVYQKVLKLQVTLE